MYHFSVGVLEHIPMKSKLGEPRITARMCLLLLLGFIRCVVFLVEQPGSTLMLWFPYVAWLSRTVSNFVPWLTTRLSLG